MEGMLTLADGTMIGKDGKPIKARASDDDDNLVEVPTNSEAVRQVTAVRKTLADLPLPPKQMNVVSIVVMYSMIGLSDNDISIALGLSVEQVGTIKMSEVYGKVYQDTTTAIIENDADDVRLVFSQYSRKAAKNIRRLADTAEAEKVRLTANQDILDRAGLRPADVVNHNITLNGGLRIEYIDKKTFDIPVVEINQ